MFVYKLVLGRLFSMAELFRIVVNSQSRVLYGIDCARVRDQYVDLNEVILVYKIHRCLSVVIIVQYRLLIMRCTFHITFDWEHPGTSTWRRLDYSMSIVWRHISGWLTADSVDRGARCELLYYCTTVLLPELLGCYLLYHSDCGVTFHVKLLEPQEFYPWNTHFHTVQ